MNPFSRESAVKNIIQTLVDLPEFLRKPILDGRLKEFFAMDTQDKDEVVSGILDTIPSFEDGELSALVKTWLTVLSNLEGVLIVEILRLYCKQIRDNPEIIQKIPIGEIIEAFSALEHTQKEKIADCLKEAILIFPDREKIVNLIPDPGLRALQMK